MILTEKTLRKWEKSNCTSLTAQQREDILERFGTEPEPYEWSEQDVAVQIRNFLECGEFVKPMMANSDGCSALPSDMEV